MSYSIDLVAVVSGLIVIVAMFVKIQVDITYIQRDLLKLSKREEERCKIEKDHENRLRHIEYLMKIKREDVN